MGSIGRGQEWSPAPVAIPDLQVAEPALLRALPQVLWLLAQTSWPVVPQPMTTPAPLCSKCTALPRCVHPFNAWVCREPRRDVPVEFALWASLDFVG